MPEPTLSFDDSAAYERLMGRWSRAVGLVFLDWLAPAPAARWLEVGCGTGIFTDLILERCSPSAVLAIDSSEAQIEHANRQPSALRANFRVADAQALPFPDATFDVIASALTINFIPDMPRALSEMRRVSRAGGVVAGYVWDFIVDRSPSGPLRVGMKRFGMAVPEIPGTPGSGLDALFSKFEQAGLREIATRFIDVTLLFPDFDTFWQAQTPSYVPTTRMITAMPASDRKRLIETVRAGLPVSPDGTIEYSARANAIKARVPD